MDKPSITIPPARITLRRRSLIFSFLVLLMAALVLPDRTWNTLLVGIGGLFLVAYGWVRLLGKELHASRHIHSRWVSVGDLLEETFALYNGSQVPALWVEVRDESNVPGYQAAIVRSPGTTRTDQWRQTAVCQQRGQYQLGPWSIRTGDPFGIFTMTRRYPQTTEILIHPPVHTQLPITLPAGQSSGRKRARQRSLQATINAATVRPYQLGDPERWIHWPTTARRDELFVREFDLDAAGDIWLLLDMEEEVQVGTKPDNTEEHAVLLAASLAARAIRQNRPVGLAGYGQQPQVVTTGVGGGQQWRLLRALALVHADGRTPLTHALYDLAHMVNRGSAAIIITPSPEIDWLPALLHLAQKGIESTVILLDRISFGGQGNPEAQRTAVQQLGLTCFLSRQGEVGIPIPEEPHGPQLRVTPLGKVVVIP